MREGGSGRRGAATVSVTRTSPLPKPARCAVRALVLIGRARSTSAHEGGMSSIRCVSWSAWAASSPSGRLEDLVGAARLVEARSSPTWLLVDDCAGVTRSSSAGATGRTRMRIARSWPAATLAMFAIREMYRSSSRSLTTALGAETTRVSSSRLVGSKAANQVCQTASDTSSLSSLAHVVHSPATSVTCFLRLQAASHPQDDPQVVENSIEGTPARRVRRWSLGGRIPSPAPVLRWRRAINLAPFPTGSDRPSGRVWRVVGEAPQADSGALPSAMHPCPRSLIGWSAIGGSPPPPGRAISGPGDIERHRDVVPS